MGRRVVLICEDSQHEYFARHVLSKLGYADRSFRVIKADRGGGSAEQFVRDRFLRELRTFQKGHTTYDLIVVCDADGKNRLTDWKEACNRGGLEWPGSDQRVALFFPNREIENWIYHLRGKDVDEARKCTKLKRAGDCQDAVEQLVGFCRSGKLPPDALPSLRQACVEYARFKALA
ncbi:MAG: hypothetical protein QM328_14955 [Acidobacteriota bacterium]|jgi:hypothetical protein|nr:hypothetical protein [Acidobacteriota bacterium]